MTTIKKSSSVVSILERDRPSKQSLWVANCFLEENEASFADDWYHKGTNTKQLTCLHGLFSHTKQFPSTTCLCKHHEESHQSGTPMTLVAIGLSRSFDPISSHWPFEGPLSPLCCVSRIRNVTGVREAHNGWSSVFLPSYHKPPIPTPSIKPQVCTKQFLPIMKTRNNASQLFSSCCQ